MLNNNEKFKDFNVLDFPENIKVVYVIFFVKDNKEVPFYVGETGRFLGRISDYISANPKASTDFKVGEAIKYLQEKGYKIIIKYKPSENRGEEQNELIRYLQDQGHRLLNDLSVKNYTDKGFNETEERERIKRFCDNILANLINL